MKAFLQRFLGITDVLESLTELRQAERERALQLEKFNELIGVHSRALGKIIAKIDPMFIIPEDDPQRKAASDHIGDEVIKKLRGEHKASNSFG